MGSLYGDSIVLDQYSAQRFQKSEMKEYTLNVMGILILV